jgi:polysaccharide export outer membrane protein
MRKAILLYLLILCGAFGAAFAQSKSLISPVTPGINSATAVALPQDSTYVIGPEDILQVNVWKEAEISALVPVRSDGKISLALLDDVQAAGLTPVQLAANISERLKRFISTPRVTVIVTAMNSRKAYIMGQVTRQGAILLVSDLTVLQALSAAGGPAPFASLRRIYVLRNEGGKQQKLPFNYAEVIKGRNTEQNIVLKPGDTIVVP